MSIGIGVANFQCHYGLQIYIFFKYLLEKKYIVCNNSYNKPIMSAHDNYILIY